MRFAASLIWLALTPPAARADPKCEQVAHGYGPRGTAELRVEVVARGLDVSAAAA